MCVSFLYNWYELLNLRWAKHSRLYHGFMINLVFWHNTVSPRAHAEHIYQTDKMICMQLLNFHPAGSNCFSFWQKFSEHLLKLLLSWPLGTLGRSAPLHTAFFSTVAGNIIELWLHEQSHLTGGWVGGTTPSSPTQEQHATFYFISLFLSSPSSSFPFP